VSPQPIPRRRNQIPGAVLAFASVIGGVLSAPPFFGLPAPRVPLASLSAPRFSAIKLFRASLSYPARAEREMVARSDLSRLG
jgi:hypothetical protein